MKGITKGIQMIAKIKKGSTKELKGLRKEVQGLQTEPKGFKGN